MKAPNSPFAAIVFVALCALLAGGCKENGPSMEAGAAYNPHIQEIVDALDRMPDYYRFGHDPGMRKEMLKEAVKVAHYPTAEIKEASEKYLIAHSDRKWEAEVAVLIAWKASFKVPPPDPARQWHMPDDSTSYPVSDVGGLHIVDKFETGVVPLGNWPMNHFDELSRYPRRFPDKTGKAGH